MRPVGKPVYTSGAPGQDRRVNDPDPRLPRQAADILFKALSPARTAGPESAELIALWYMTKMLNAVGDGLNFSSVPEAERPRAQWHEAALNASDIAGKALAIIADSMTPQQAAGWLEDRDAISVGLQAVGCGGTIELIGPDHMETERTLTVTIDGDRLRSLSVTADRGPAPEPRPQTVATLLRIGWLLNQLAAALGELVLELPEDGIPLCGRADEEVTCEVCQRTVGADVTASGGLAARKPSGRLLDPLRPGCQRRRAPRVAPSDRLHRPRRRPPGARPSSRRCDRRPNRTRPDHHPKALTWLKAIACT
jgi:hypothetical protein